jgi:hypothetical protein
VVNGQGHETDHSLQFSVDIKKDGAIPSLPHTFSWRGALLTKHRNKFIFTKIEEKGRKLEGVAEG